MNELKKAVRGVIRDKFGFKVKKLEIFEDTDADEDEVLRVLLSIDNGSKKIKKADGYYVIGAVGRAIGDTGEKRYPLIDVKYPPIERRKMDNKL